VDLSTIGTFVLGGGGLLTGLLALYSARATKNKTQAEAGKTSADAGVSKATEKEIEVRAVAMSEKTFQDREKFWSDRVEEVRESCEKDVNELKEEVGWLRILIENHVPWDWEAIRKLKLADIEQRNPPTLNYVRKREQQRKKEEENDAS
jgi:hypothetical protein